MKKSLWSILAILVSTALVAAIIYKTRRTSVRVDMAKVELDLRAHVSEGASRAEVESYLDQRGIKHSYVTHSMAAPEYSRTELALIPETSRSWLIRGDIQILFRFDDRDKLTQYSVKEIFAGP